MALDPRDPLHRPAVLVDLTLGAAVEVHVQRHPRQHVTQVHPGQGLRLAVELGAGVGEHQQPQHPTVIDTQRGLTRLSGVGVGVVAEGLTQPARGGGDSGVEDPLLCTARSARTRNEAIPSSVFPIRSANRACRARCSFSRANAGAAAATFPCTNTSNRDHGSARPRTPRPPHRRRPPPPPTGTGSGRTRAGHTTPAPRPPAPDPQLRVAVVQVLRVSDQRRRDIGRAPDPRPQLSSRELRHLPGPLTAVPLRALPTGLRALRRISRAGSCNTAH